jgi:catechol 2,3-dioxygenase-like lactoylglutathione lyase family enzyme
MLKIGSIVWGVRDVPRAIRFWSDALRYRPLREPSDDWAILVPEAGPGVQFAITVVSSDAKDHQRHHLDLYARDAQAEIERLIALGARRVEWRYPPNADYVVLADPDGNTFCVIEKPAAFETPSRPPHSD